MTTKAAPVDALAVEHAHLQRATREARAKATTPADTAFVRAMRAVMDDYLAARAAGLSREEGVVGIEVELRERWLHRPTKYGPACDDCDDTGWRQVLCSARDRCGREACATGHPAREHTYVVPCSCVRGDRHAGRQRATPPPATPDASATRPRRRPRPGFTRMGGR